MTAKALNLNGLLATAIVLAMDIMLNPPSMPFMGTEALNEQSD